jgi:Ca-activated chloride channel family protein
MTLPISFQVAWPGALAVTLPLFVWLIARSRNRLVRRHLIVAAVLRGLALVSLALALMRPLWHAESGDVSVVYALDVSRSVSPGFIDSAIKWIGLANGEAHPAAARYVAFADHAILLQKPEDLRTVAVSPGGAGANPTVLDQSATNLERALDTALLGLDGERAKRIVLLTDGNQTAGDLWRVLARLTRAHVRVYPIPAKLRDPRDVGIARIDMPEAVNSAEPFNATVRIVCAFAGPAQVVLRSEKALLGSRKVQLKTGLNNVVFETKLMRTGTNTLSAEVLAKGDQTTQNNHMKRSVWVRARPNILYVEGGQPESARYLADALNAQGLIVNVIAADALPASAGELARYDGLILSDAPANSLSSEQMQAVESYVRDSGGGLLFASGENVHGEHGYSDTLIEQILPVQFRAQEKRKDLVLVVALDRSYSMKGRKMDMAKEATRAALDLLEEQHRFGVVAFDSQPYVAVPLQYVRSRRKAQDQISRVQASGQTNIYPALGIIYRLLQKTDAKAKHVILLSDGDTHPADFENLVKRMAAEHIVLSTVAVGTDADRVLMSDIAKWGKGRAYVAESAESIPQIFIEETERAVRSNLQELDFKPVLKVRSATFRDLSVDNLPELKGYVSSKARDHAEVLLAGPSGAPLLARWQYGLGKVVAFTSDVKNRWASNWIAWSGYGKFWAQQVRDLLRRDSGEEVDFDVVREGGEAVIKLSALTPAGNFRNDLAPKVRITRSDGSNSVVLLEQTGPGAYQLHLPIDSSVQTEHFQLLESPGLPKSASGRAGMRVLHQDFADEFQVMSPDIALLNALANATGGKLAPSVSEIFAQQGDESSITRELWPWLALLGLIFYLLDIAVRRAPLAWRLLEVPRPA